MHNESNLAKREPFPFSLSSSKGAMWQGQFGRTPPQSSRPDKAPCSCLHPCAQQQHLQQKYRY